MYKFSPKLYRFMPRCIGLILVAIFTIGATFPAEPQFKARASTLHPEPIVATQDTPAVVLVTETTREAYTGNGAVQSTSGGLTGSIGYARCGGNCVNEPGVKRRNGNPITWLASTRTPYIGATALWTYNHTGVVVGIWANGDLEVRHQNYCGGQHRFPRSAFRGFI